MYFEVQGGVSGHETGVPWVLKRSIHKTSENQLTVDGEAVVIPDDKEVEYKIKYDDDAFEGSLSMKITWMNAEAEVKRKKRKRKNNR